jgi:hypothetical protein
MSKHVQRTPLCAMLQQMMAGLGFEPRPPGIIPGALPLSYLTLGEQLVHIYTFTSYDIHATWTDCTSNTLTRGSGTDRRCSSA